MSSALFYVRVMAIGGREVDLDCVTTGASGYQDLCTDRSFALIALCDAGYQSPIDLAVRALERGNDDRFDEGWVNQHVGTFVEWTRLRSRRNAIGEAALRLVFDDIRARGLSGRARLDELRRRGHGYVLRVHVTDKKWLSHLRVGLDYDTVGYDVLAY